MISTLQSYQANLGTLLSGKLGRLFIICNNQQQEECLQFTIMQSWWAVPNTALVPGWITAGWTCPGYQKLTSNLPLSAPMEGVCRFSIPLDLHIDLAGDVASAELFINEEPAISLPPFRNAINSTTMRFVDTASVNERSAYIIDLLAVAPLARNGAIMVQMRMQDTFILSGWSCYSVDAALTLTLSNVRSLASVGNHTHLLQSNTEGGIHSFLPLFSSNAQ